MRKTLVTGASGFVGSAVLRLLVENDRDVAILVRKTSDTRRIADLIDRVTVIEGDLSDLDSAADQVYSFAPDGVIHLAWSGVRGGERNSPAQAENVFAAINLYRMASAAGAQRFVGLGSQAEYGSSPSRITESGPTFPTTVYGAAKLATFHILDRIAATEERSFAWLRLFSSYGPGDDESWLIPYVTLRLLEGKSPALTRCEQLWDYIFVDDVAEGIVATFDSDVRGVLNLGAGRTYPLADVVTKIRDMIDPAIALRFGEIPYRPDQVMHLEADIGKLTESTAWAPKVSINEGLSKTVQWYRARREVKR